MILCLRWLCVSEEAEGSETERGYHKLQQAEPTEKAQESDDNLEDDEDDEDSSDLDSDSECGECKSHYKRI